MNWVFYNALPIRVFRVLSFSLMLLWTSVPFATEVSRITSSASDIEQKVSVLERQYLGVAQVRGSNYVTERLIEGENTFRLKDYRRAAILFMDIIESHPDHPGYADALFYFSESLFLSRDYHGARGWFFRFMEEEHRTRNSRFRTTVIARLIEIAIHLSSFDGVEKYVDMLGQIPELSDEYRYIQGRFQYFSGNYAAARSAFQTVRDQTLLELKAAYFIGVTWVKEREYMEAVKVFEETMTRFPEVSAEHREILDLINLGIGRIYYELDMVTRATEAYRRVGRYSTYYDAALYETASVYMREKDTIAAERVLEVLTLTVPQSRYVPMARLYRGHLLLQENRYDQAEEVFEQTIAEFSPIQEQMERLIMSGDAGSFFDELILRSSENLEISGVLPTEVARWLVDEPQLQRAFHVTRDLEEASVYSQESERLFQLVEAVVEGSTSPVHAVPILRRAMRQSLQMNYELGQLMIRWMKAVESRSAAKKLPPQEFFIQRRELEKAMLELPVSEAQFVRREETSREVYVRMRRELARQEQELNRLDAIVVGLETFMDKPEYREDMDAGAIEAYRTDLTRFRDGVRRDRQELRQLMEQSELAEARLGFGEDTVLEQDLMKKADVLCSRYLEYAMKQLGNEGPTLSHALEVIRAASTSVNRLMRAIDAEANHRLTDIRTVLAQERQRLSQYKRELSVLDEEGRIVVNGVTRENFGGIRDRFHRLLLGADVGIIDIAWLRKEAHKQNSIAHSSKRAAELRELEREFSRFGELILGGSLER